MWRRRRLQSALDADPGQVAAALRDWAAALDVARVTDHTVRQAEFYLRNYRHMAPFSRHEAGLRLMAMLTEQVTPPPPPSVAPLDAVATVLRRMRSPQAGAD